MKHTFLHTFFCLLYWLTLFNNLHAQDSTSHRKKGGFVVLPVLSTSPETSLSFGAIGMYLFKFNYKDTLTRTSNVQAYFIYTLRNQLLTSPSYTLFFNQEKYILRGNIAYFQFPEYFYGIGNSPLDKANRIGIDYELFRIENRFLRKVKGNFFAGIQHRYLEIYNVKYPAGSLIDQINPVGKNGSSASGLGVVLLYDDRDNVVNTFKGTFVELSTLSHGGIGGNSVYDVFRADLRQFIPIIPKKNHILGLQFLGVFTTGAPPMIRQNAELGDDAIMRGYYRGRYRDRNYIAFQVEYRFPVWKFIGANAFVGTGSVAREISEFTNWLPNFGVGVRFMVNKKDRVNIRLDYGVGYQTSDIYLNLGEAF
ncbi:MAG: hypothetical protein NZ551_03045 [Microscillaceae bacterium]|nr:hypothetical protein [Microscillaceae bacterium]MDW8460164.1 hypothetical protein [Cytophagales bacterium]